MPDFKAIADFRKDNGEAIRKVCGAFVLLCRRLGLLGEAKNGYCLQFINLSIALPRVGRDCCLAARISALNLRMVTQLAIIICFEMSIRDTYEASELDFDAPDVEAR